MTTTTPSDKIDKDLHWKPPPSDDKPMQIVVLADTTSPAYQAIAQMNQGQQLEAAHNIELLVGDSVDGFVSDFGNDKLRQTDAVLVVPPTDIQVLDQLWQSHWSPKVKWIHCFFAGVDSMADFMQQRLNGDAVTVTNGRGAFSSSLAEYIMASALYYNKQVPRCQQNLRQKKWDKFIMPVLKGKTMGFVGYGNIAKHAAQIAKNGFGMKIGVLRKNPNKLESESEVAVDVVFTDKQKVFANSDFVVCTLPGTPETQHFCSTAEFAAMKDDAVFISCGRGVAVDETALAQALNEERIYAALDVFEIEPLPQTSPLWTVPDGRLLMTAHNADYTTDYFELGIQVFLENLHCYKDGRPFQTIVDKSAGY